MPKPPVKPSHPDPELEEAAGPEEEGESPDGATIMMDAPPEIEEEGGDEEQPPDGATVVFNTSTARPQPARRSTVSAKLVVTAGPKAGSEFVLGPGDTVVGRQNDCTVVISDISVSRRHVLLRRDGAVYRLTDLGSGNGTLLNGQRVEGETELQDGDVFTMGDSEVTFQMQSAPAPRPAPRPGPRPGPRTTTGSHRPAPPPGHRPGPLARPRPAAPEAEEPDEMTGRFDMDRGAAQKKRRKKLLLLTAVTALLVLGLVVVKKLQNDVANQAVAAQAGAEIDQIQTQMNEALEAGKAATRSGDFRSAVKAFQKAIEAADNLNTNYGAEVDPRDAKTHLEHAQGEVANQESVDKIKDLVGKGELAKAAELIKAIPDSSYFYDKIGELQDALKAKIPDRLSAGRASLASRDFEAARRAVDDVQAVDPGNADAKKLTEDIDRAGAPKPKPKPVVAAPVDYSGKALEAFNAGKLDDAIGIASSCDDPKCAALKAQLTAFRDAYKDVENNPDKAVNALKAIPGGGSSKYMADIGPKVSGKFVKEGIKAMGSDNMSAAFKAFYRALQLDPGNAVATKHMATIHSKASELFQQGYVDKGVDPEKARHELEQVLSMTAPEDELHQKAAKHIKSLGGGY